MGAESTPPGKVLIATRNAHKLREIRAVLPLDGVTLLSALDFPGIPDVVEDGDTLEANAIKKALVLHQATGLMSLADDSGLEVEALDGAPGVYSARWSGEGCTAEENNAKLLRELQGASSRRARFRTVIALACADFPPQTVEGEIYGMIAKEGRGAGGFGYDPLFIPDGFTQTFAEMTAEVKNHISHRALALQAAASAWRDLFRGSAFRGRDA